MAARGEVGAPVDDVLLFANRRGRKRAALTKPSPNLRS